MQVLCPRINKKQTHSKITSQLSLAEFILIALIYKIFKTIKPPPPPPPTTQHRGLFLVYLVTNIEHEVKEQYSLHSWCSSGHCIGRKAENRIQNICLDRQIAQSDLKYMLETYLLKYRNINAVL